MRGTILEVPIIRIILFWGLYWGPSISGNYHTQNKPEVRIYGLKGLQILHFIGFSTSTKYGTEDGMSFPVIKNNTLGVY